MVKACWGIILWLVCSLGGAAAGDFAERDIIGFSTSGDLFAFEEYGVQDGSGFPYSSIYVIDTATDTWTAGSPFRAVLQDESATLAQARRATRAAASAVLSTITEPGLIAATNRATEMVDNPYRMVARPRHFVPPTGERIEFRIARKWLPVPESCQEYGDVRGFELIRIDAAPGGQTVVMHSDTAILSSRNCPLDYRLADIVTYHPPNGDRVVAVMILMETIGFEGPNGRFLAVTGRF